MATRREFCIFVTHDLESRLTRQMTPGLLSVPLRAVAEHRSFGYGAATLDRSMCKQWTYPLRQATIQIYPPSPRKRENR
jgi:cytochrome c2